MLVDNTVTDKDGAARIRAALRYLTLRFPLAGLSLMGATVLIHEDLTTKTLCTDGRCIWYNPDWLRETGEQGTIFDVLHEWFHIFGNHPKRLGDRHPRVWNHAVDIIAVREASRILGWPPPKDGIQPEPWAEKMNAEQIYDELIKRDPFPSTKLECRGGNDLRESKMKPAEDERFRENFTQELVTVTLSQEFSTGQTADALWGDSIASRVAELRRGRVPWGRLLCGDLINELGDEEVTYSPPNRKRFPHLILPTFFSPTESKLLLGVDVSASVGESLFAEFKSNIRPAAARATETIIVTFDQVIREVVHTTNPERVLNDIKFSTGAHSMTSVVDVFKKVDELRPSAVCVLTDGHVLLPRNPYPRTIWVTPWNGGVLPWGKTYKMDVSW